MNSLEEMNVSIVTNMDPVINSCAESLVLIGGRTNDRTFSYFNESSKYVTSNAGKKKWTLSL